MGVAWYKTGTVSVTNGSKVVTGSGTNFSTVGQLNQGDIFTIDFSKLYEINTVDSDGQITLVDAYTGTTASGQNFAIIPIQYTNLSNAAIAGKVAALLSSWQGREDEFSNWLSGQAGYGYDSAGNAIASPPDTANGGYFPMTDASGTTRYVKCPAQMSYDISTGWHDTNDVPTYVSANSFTVPGDQASKYTDNTPIKCVDSSTLYGYISSSSYSSVNSKTTVTVTLDSGFLSVSLSAVALGVDASTQSLPSEAVRFNDGRTNAVARTVEQILAANAINVVSRMTSAQFTDFLAGGTGSVDMYSALNNAAMDAAAAGKSLYLPGYTYPIGTMWTIPTGIRVIGEGMARDQKVTCIQPTSAVATGVYLQHADNTHNGFALQHIAIDMVNMTIPGSIGLHIDGNWYNDIDDIFVDNIASATNNVGIQLNSSSGYGTYVSNWGAVRFSGGSTSGGTSGSIGLKIVGTSSVRVTSLQVDILEFGNIETGVSSDYTGSGIAVKYFYPASTVTYGWVSTNHSSTDMIQILGGEFDATSYNFSGPILVSQNAVAGSGTLANAGTGVRCLADKDTVTLSAATDAIDPVFPYVQLKSNSGSLTLTSNPQISAGYPGQKITLTGGSNSNFVVLSNGNGLNLKSSAIKLTQYTSITLVYDNSFTNKWVEVSRSEESGAYSATVAAGGTDNGRFFQGRLREITCTGSTATIGFPTDGNDGDVITYKIYNNSGGALTVSWNYQFKKDSTYADPANGKYRLITFVKSADGYLYQVSCTGDI